MTASLIRISAMIRRYFSMMVATPMRLVGVFYWPVVHMILWGFISQYFGERAGLGAQALGMFLGAMLLWETMFRAQLGVSISYMDELWSRNVGHLFVSPIRQHEWWLAAVVYSVLRVLAGMLPAMLLAIPFYGFSVFSYGVPYFLLFMNLVIMGWWLGFLVMALLIRLGPSAEEIAWALTFMLAPFCAVYYPVTVLPAWLQPVSSALPATQVFEGLRTLVATGVQDNEALLNAFGLNMIYMAVSLAILAFSFRDARKRGGLVQTGE